MSFPPFRSFWPVGAAKWLPTAWLTRWKAIVDANTGAVVGIQSQDATGPDGIWAPVPLTQAQISAAIAGDISVARILADLNATYQLNAAPYSRYRSDGTTLVPLDEGGGTVIPAGQIWEFVSPLQITEQTPMFIRGGIRVIA